MIKVKKITISLSLEKMTSFLDKRRLWIIGAIFVLLLCFNAFIYYQYIYRIMIVQPEPEIEKMVINQELLENFLNGITARQGNLSRVKTADYPDPFND